MDSADPTNSNWLRYVNSPRTDAEENVLPVDCIRNVFYVVSRNIAPKTELMVSYGSNYDENLGIVRNHPGIDSFEYNVLGIWSFLLSTLKKEN